VVETTEVIVAPAVDVVVDEIIDQAEAILRHKAGGGTPKPEELLSEELLDAAKLVLLVVVGIDEEEW
jgi:hypothetical protein